MAGARVASYRTRGMRRDSSVTSNSRTEMKLGEDELRQVTLYAAACARRVLPVFEASRPDDHRPREAIVEAEAFGAGKRRTATLRASAWAAHAAAREAEGGPVAHAAYAASQAAAAAFLHPIANPHQVKHVLGSAVHQALVFELEAGRDKGAGYEQLRWAARLASPSVRSVLQRYPSPRRGRGRFSELLSELDAALRPTVGSPDSEPNRQWHSLGPDSRSIGLPPKTPPSI
jgi:hypothetical protein